jgi:hypothetical protein
MTPGYSRHPMFLDADEILDANEILANEILD